MERSLQLRLEQRSHAKIVESLIALAVKRKTTSRLLKLPLRLPARTLTVRESKEVVDGKKVTVYDEVEKEIKKDMPSRLHARRQMVKVLYDVTEVPTAAAGKKKNTKKVDLTNKLFNEIAPKYASRNGGYTRIIKIGQRKGDGAMAVLIELV
ncbi:MAG: bL17 family ribosomal protein [Roseburia sp.]